MPGILLVVFVVFALAIVAAAYRCAGYTALFVVAFTLVIAISMPSEPTFETLLRLILLGALCVAVYRTWRASKLHGKKHSTRRKNV